MTRPARHNPPMALVGPTRRTLLSAYRRLLLAQGHAGWWPGQTPFEICLGAILTQNTAWTNVEKALTELRRRHLLTYAALAPLSADQIAPLIRSAGFFNVKARRIGAFLDFLGREYAGRVGAMGSEPALTLRSKLLAVHGIGRETADSMALYAAGLPLFVVDAYTRRIGSRLGWIAGDEEYDEVQRFFMVRLPEDVALFNDFHAQIVLLGKDTCRPRPRCDRCPLGTVCLRRGVRSDAASAVGARPGVGARLSARRARPGSARLRRPGPRVSTVRRPHKR
jgi:endonuclease-3 related protein